MFHELLSSFEMEMSRVVQVVSLPSVGYGLNLRKQVLAG